MKHQNDPIPRSHHLLFPSNLILMFKFKFTFNALLLYKKGRASQWQFLLNVNVRSAHRPVICGFSPSHLETWLHYTFVLYKHPSHISKNRSENEKLRWKQASGTTCNRLIRIIWRTKISKFNWEASIHTTTTREFTLVHFSLIHYWNRKGQNKCLNRKA